VLDRRGKALAFAKVSRSALSRQLVQNEALTLTALASRASLVDRVPKLLLSTTIDGSHVAIQDALPGRSAGARFTDDHARLLALLSEGAPEEPPKPAVETRLVSSLRIRCTAPGAGLGAAFNKVEQALGDARFPQTIVHGDFAPWNLRRQAEGLGAFDWEYAELDGLPLQDVTHFLMQTGRLLENWTPAQTADALRAMVHRHASNGLTARHVRGLQAVYLLSALCRHHDEGHPEDRDFDLHDALLRRLLEEDERA